ncbi:MAG: ABC transporter permease [Gammaproteobacteria bacterium]|nr:ABC transporter permease [Gammaproteobacteria bacterium]
MRVPDLIKFSIGAVRAHRQRSLLTILGIAVGIATVVLLTALGEGLRQFVVGEFTQFGTNLIAIQPGKASTLGGSVGQISTNRPLSIDDARALSRLSSLDGIVPVIQGNAQVKFGDRKRRTMIFGVSAALPRTFRMTLAIGRFLPNQDYDNAQAFAVLGAKLYTELFGRANPLGARIRVGEDSFRVAGVMQPKGQFLGFDLDDTLYVPVSKAAALFNRNGVHEIDVLYRPGLSSAHVSAEIKRLLIARHGQEDFSLTAQDKMLEVMGSILTVLTAGVAALGGISLVVGAVGIATIMTIALTERVGEVGLLRALGATHGDILRCFLLEAAALGAIGGAAGVVLAVGAVTLLRTIAPTIPVQVAWPYAGAALGFAVVIGITAGLAPAVRAARLDPVEALRAE